MFYLIAILIGIVLGLADALLLKKDAKRIPTTIITDTFISNIGALLAAKIAFLLTPYNTPLFPISSHSKRFIFIYGAFEIVIGIVWVLIFKQIKFEKDKNSNTNENKKKHSKAINIISVIFVFLSMVLFAGTIWGKNTFNNVAIDEMIATLLSPTVGTSSEVMLSLWKPILAIILVTTAFALLVFRKGKFIFKGLKKDITIPHRIIALILAVLMFFSGFAYCAKEFQLDKLVKMYATDSRFIKNNFVDPRETKMEFPEKKRNLVYIYLESMENSYLSKDMGGNLDENLLAPLTELAVNDGGYVFSNTDNFFGGPMPTTGCTWSVASMVNQNAGIPMKVPTARNSYGTPGNFMPGAVMTGDILASIGYEQTLMFGASAVFGGLKYMYEQHGNFNFLDYDGAKEKGLIPENYKVYWGYEDDKLYEFAKDELTRMHNTGKPFYFVMETADTHFPDGYVGKNTPRTRDSQYADVIAYSASEVTKFINWIKEQPFYENTTIILIGDHLSMDKNFFKDWDKNYERTQFNLILNPSESIGEIPEERLRNRYWANFDMFPTSLASIGVKIEGDRLALGTNLFSGEKTLFERNGGKSGWEYANKELDHGSLFYKKTILESEYRPFDTKNITEYK